MSNQHLFGVIPIPRFGPRKARFRTRHEDERGRLIRTGNVIASISTVLIFGFVIFSIIVFSHGSDSSGGDVYWKTIATCFVLTTASFVGGGVIGFLFGIPRSLRGSANPDDPSGTGGYAANTNLEEASDWLTKILLGAGLAQLAEVPGALQSLVQFLADHLGLENSEPFLGALIVALAAFGFIAGYIGTRIFLPVAFFNADQAQTVPDVRDDVGFSLEQAEQALIENLSGTDSERHQTQVQEWINARDWGTKPAPEDVFQFAIYPEYREERSEFLAQSNNLPS